MATLSEEDWGEITFPCRMTSERAVVERTMEPASSTLGGNPQGASDGQAENRCRSSLRRGRIESAMMSRQDTK